MTVSLWLPVFARLTARVATRVGLDLKQVAKRCAGKYACGSSVVKDPAGFDEVVIQGDVVDDLIEFIPAEWPAIDAKKIHVDRKK